MSSVMIGVDVGTGSARAGLFGRDGRLLVTARRDIALWRGPGGVVEHSTADIWRAVTDAVREAVGSSGLPPAAVAGIGFAATSSLVALGSDLAPVSLSPTNGTERDVIAWMDHRAIDDAARITAGGAEALRYFGGSMSPEMQPPKLAWAQREKPEVFARAAHFLGLTDYLTFRATDSLSRSLCSAACKFGYLAHAGEWPADIFRSAGLGTLVAEKFQRLGSEILAPGTPLGAGLTGPAAAAMGLCRGTPVGAGLIDAHAGAAGTLGAPGQEGALAALILGTSACCMALAREPRFVEGVWGPYFSVLTPGDWLTEGGQSAFGAAIDHLMTMHPRFAETAKRANGMAFQQMERDILAIAGDFSSAALLSRDLHILPDFLGNRSPHADSNARGVLFGIDLRDDYESLLRLYVAGLTGLAHGLAQVIRTLEAGGYECARLVVSGGAARSALVRQLMADVTGKVVHAPETTEPVLLGAAMLGAVAADGRTLRSAMSSMSHLAERSLPHEGEIAAFHRRKRTAFEAIQHTEQNVRSLMGPSGI